MLLRPVRVVASGRCVPARTVTNAELEALTGRAFDAWLRENTGIEARCWMEPGEVTSDLAARAARDALAHAGWSAEDLDLIVVATDTPDSPSPGTSAVLQHKLGAQRAGAFDVNCACAGFVTALDQAARTVATAAPVRRALVVGAYGMSRHLDLSDKRTGTLFADGAGAVLLEAGSPGEAPGYLGGRMEADGQYHDALGIFAGGTARPATAAEVAAHGPPRVEFARRLPGTFNLERWPRLVRAVLQDAGVSPDAVDLYVFTQLNLGTIRDVMADLGQPLDRTHWIMDRWGYTGSACVPMCLDHAVERGKLRPGGLVCLCASGGGVSLAAAVFRWAGPAPAPVG